MFFLLINDRHGHAAAVDYMFRWAAGGGIKDRVGLFFPAGRERELRFAFKRVFEVCDEEGFKAALAEVLCLAYDPNQVSGIPFVIGESCQKHALQAALILGPESGTGLSEQKAEFEHIVRHILEELTVKMGWVPYELLGCRPAFIRCCLDLIRQGGERV